MKRRFVDTNVVLYSVSEEDADAEKREIARKILASYDLAFSVQVLQEFYVQAIRSKNKHPLSHREALDVITDMKYYPVQPMTVEILDAALVTKDRHQISYWDAAIIEAARALGCGTVIS